MPSISLIFIICKHFLPKVHLHMNKAVGSFNVFLSPSVPCPLFFGLCSQYLNKHFNTENSFSVPKIYKTRR